MDLLIHYIAAAIARRIEHGSIRSAFIGLMLGLAAGWIIAVFLWWQDWARGAIVFIPVILGALLGPLFGSQRGVDEKPLEISAGLQPDESVYVTDLNHALIPILGFGVLLFLCGVLWYAAWNYRLDPVAVAIVGSILGLLLIFAGAGSCYVVLWVKLADQVVVRRLVTRRAYSRSQIEQWGFEVQRGKLTQTPPDDVVPFVLVLPNGLRFSTDAAPHKAHDIARALYGVPGSRTEAS